MRKFSTTTLLLLLFFCTNILVSQVYYGSEAQKFVPGTEMIKIESETMAPTYLKFAAGNEIDQENLFVWMRSSFGLTQNNEFNEISRLTDQTGYTHIRYQQSFNGIPVLDGIIIIHIYNSKIHSINGNIYKNLNIKNSIVLSEKAALDKALNFVNADRYKWEMPAEEELLKRLSGDSEATYYPKGKLTILPDAANNNFDDHYYAYVFNIYADKPLRRSDFYIDASSGEMLFENKIIKTATSYNDCIHTHRNILFHIDRS